MSNNKTDNSNNISIIETDLVNELSKLIDQSQQNVIIHNNSVLTMLFWQIGFRINETILQNKRAEYGKRIVPTVSAQLEENFGRNFTKKNVRRMLRFAEQFIDMQSVVVLSRKLSWFHFIELLPIKNQEAKFFMRIKLVIN